MFKKVVLVIIIILLLAYLIPLGLVLLNKDSKIQNDVDYLIVLGAKVNGEYPSAMLQYRLESTYDYYLKHSEITVVVTGGQGNDEEYPEAYVMKNTLVEMGVPANKIIQEEKSTNTFENLDNTKKMINNGVKDYQVGVVTNDFHIYRSNMICKRVFEQNCQMLSARSYDGIQGTISILREPFALYKSFIFDR